MHYTRAKMLSENRDRPLFQIHKRLIDQNRRDVFQARAQNLGFGHDARPVSEQVDKGDGFDQP